MKAWKIIRNSSIVVLFIGFVAFTLYSNKAKTEEKAKLVEKTVSVFPVVVSKAELREYNGGLNATGTFEPYRELTFVSETQGRIISLLIDKGYFVSEGQVIAKLDDESLQRELKIAKINYDKAQKDLQRFENLSKANATTEVNVDNARFAFQNAEQQIEALKERLVKTLVKVPISGIITRKVVEKGSYLMPGTPIADITDMHHLKMVVKVSEKEILKVKEGQKITLKSDIYPDRSYQGVVKTIAVKADQSKRYEVDIDLQNSSDKPLKAGMYGTAYFGVDTKKSSLMIPRKAVVGSLKDGKIFVVNTDVAELRSIQTGSVQEEWVEVVSGLKEGDKVIITGQINLQNGSKVSIIK